LLPRVSWLLHKLGGLTVLLVGNPEVLVVLKEEFRGKEILAVRASGEAQTMCEVPTISEAPTSPDLPELVQINSSHSNNPSNRGRQLNPSPPDKRHLLDPLLDYPILLSNTRLLVRSCISS